MKGKGYDLQNRISRLGVAFRGHCKGHIIASAPDLLEALADIMGIHTSDYEYALSDIDWDGKEIWDRAFAAIKKATEKD